MKELSLLSVLFCSVCSFTWAQKKDTSRIDLLQEQQIQFWGQNPRDQKEWSAPDTSLNTFHYHYPAFWNLQSFQGYLGSPTHFLHFRNSNNSGINPNYDQLAVYRVHSSNSPFYQVKQPLTQAFYVWSTRREELFQLHHTQNLTENFNVAAQYQRISNQGWFDRQRLAFNGVSINTNYADTLGRYELKTSAAYNNNLSEENGGYSSLDEFAGEQRRLRNAESKSRTQEFAVKQVFRLGDINTSNTVNVGKDSILDTVITRKFTSKHVIEHELHFYRGFYEFQDTLESNPNAASSPLYLNPFDSNIQDKQDVSSLENKLSWQPESESKKIFFKTSLYTQYFRLVQGPRGSFSNEFVNNHIVPELSILGNKQSLAFKLNYGITGYTRNDLAISSLATRNLNTIWKATLGLNLDSYQPEFFLSNYQQGQFQWNIQHAKTQVLQLNANLLNNNQEGIHVSYRLINNYTFLNQNLRPEQWNPEISLLEVSLQKQFDLNKLHLLLKGIYQVSNHSNILGIPDYVLFSSLYYETNMFSKHMVGRFGADIFYTSNYEPYSYFPLMRSFYQQTGFTTGQYPLLDVYFACQVVTARFFIKGTNLLQALTGQTYLLTDGFPINPSSLKIGLNWYFLN